MSNYMEKFARKEEEEKEALAFGGEEQMDTDSDSDDQAVFFEEESETDKISDVDNNLSSKMEGVNQGGEESFQNFLLYRVELNNNKLNSLFH